MTGPLVVLAGFALFAGLAFGPWTGVFEHHLTLTPGFAEEAAHGHSAEHSADLATIFLGSAAGLIGIALAWLLYFKPSPIPARIAALASGRPYQWSLHKFFIDELYDAVIVRPLRGVAVVSRFFDEYVISGIVSLVAWVPRAFGRNVAGPLQNGLVQYYAAVTALCVVGLLVVLLLF